MVARRISSLSARNNLTEKNERLRMTPPMATGVTSKRWEVSDLVALLEAAASKKAA
jgi:hypothetical protein